MGEKGKGFKTNQTTYPKHKINTSSEKVTTNKKIDYSQANPDPNPNPYPNRNPNP